MGQTESYGRDQGYLNEGVELDVSKSRFQVIDFEKYQKLLESRNGPMALISNNNRYICMNERNAKFFGFSSVEEAMKEMKDAGPGKFSPEKQQIKMRVAIMASKRSKTGVHSFNCTHTKKNGSERKVTIVMTYCRFQSFDAFQVLLLPEGKYDNPMKKFAKLTSTQYEIFDLDLPTTNPQFSGENMAIIGGTLRSPVKKVLVLDSTGKHLFYKKKIGSRPEGTILIDRLTLIRLTKISKCFEITGPFRTLFRIEGETEEQAKKLRDLLEISQKAQADAIPSQKPSQSAHVSTAAQLSVHKGKIRYKVLIVLAHMNTGKSCNHAMANAAVNHLRKNGCEVRLVDLHVINFDPLPGPGDFKKVQNNDFFDYQVEQKYAVHNDNFNDQIKKQMEHVEWCDLMIWQFPMRWWTYPTILKGWIDKVFAFHFVYGGGKELKAGIMLSVTSGGTYEDIEEKFSFGNWGYYKFKQVKPFVVGGVFPFIDGKKEEGLFLKRQEELAGKMVKHLDENVLGGKIKFAIFEDEDKEEEVEGEDDATTSMKAIVYHKYGGPEEMVLESVPIPEPQDGEVRVRVFSTAVNAADYKLRNGWMSMFVKIKNWPVCFGYDLSGVVDKVGKDVKEFKVGDHVSGLKQSWLPSVHSGTFCEYVCLPESCVATKPQGVSWQQAAAIPVGTLTAKQIVDLKLKDNPGKSVLIMGASGGVGVFAVQFSKLAGCEKIIVSGSSRNHEFLKKLGGTHCIDYKTQNVAEEVKKLCPDGVDVILDCATGNKEQLEAIDGCVKGDGTIISISNFFYKKRNVEFVTYQVKPDGRQLGQVLSLIEEKKIEVPIGGVWAFDEVQEAFRVMETSHPPGKLVVDVHKPEKKEEPRMKVLIILAHPNTGKSVNHVLSKRAREHLIKNNCEVRLVDLYAEGFDPLPGPNDFKRMQSITGFFDYQSEQKFALEYDNYNDQIKKQMEHVEWCDLMIWQFPIHWFSYPAILKGWIDKVFAYHFVYGGGKETLKAGIMMSITSGGSYDDIEEKFSFGCWEYYSFKIIKPFITGGVFPFVDGKKEKRLFLQRQQILSEKLCKHIDENILGNEINYVKISTSSSEKKQNPMTFVTSESDDESVMFGDEVNSVLQKFEKKEMNDIIIENERYKKRLTELEEMLSNGKKEISIKEKKIEELKKKLDSQKRNESHELSVLKEEFERENKLHSDNAERVIRELKQQTIRTRSEHFLSTLENDEQLVLDPSLHFRIRFFVGINQRIDQIIFHDTGRGKGFKDFQLRQKEQIPDCFFETIVSDPQKDVILKKFLKTIRSEFLSKWKECQQNIKKNHQQLTEKEFVFFKNLITSISNFFGGITPDIQQKCDQKIKKLKEEKMKEGKPCNMIYLGELEGNGICRHRSILFKLVCDLLGIRCRLLRGWFRHNEKNYGHCWNMVQVGGRFFIVDVMNKLTIFPDIEGKSYVNLGGPSIEVEKEKKTLDLIERDYLQNRELINSGSFASVYEVEVDFVDEYKSEEDFTTKPEIVAVKELNVSNLSEKTGSDFWKYCEREIMFLKFLNHPNIIHFIGSFKRTTTQRRTKRKQEYLCLVMEFYDRTCYSFKSELEKEENSVDFTFYHKLCELFIFLIEVCKGLRYVHSVGVIHFDLHPDNILVKWNEDRKRISKVAITDFGGAKEKEASFRTSLPAGAPMFTAPEILELRMKAVQEGNLQKVRDYQFTEKSDIYSLGKVMEIFNSLLEGFPEVVKLEKECLEKNPTDRPSLEKMMYIFKNRLRYVNEELKKLSLRNRRMKNVFEDVEGKEEVEGED